MRLELRQGVWLPGWPWAQRPQVSLTSMVVLTPVKNQALSLGRERVQPRRSSLRGAMV